MQLGGKKSPYRGTVPFWLYIVCTDLIRVFLYVMGPINTFFSIFCKTYMAKISQISFSSVKRTTCIIIKFIKNHV